MSTVQLRNVNPLGDVDAPFLGLLILRGAVFTVDTVIAGRVPNPADPADPGEGLLGQVGNYEPA